MVHRDVPESRSADSADRADFLPFQAWNRLEPTLVEELRGKRADVRVKPPGVFQEQPLMCPDGELAVQNVVQGRDARAFRMAPLRRLVQLPRIPQQHQ